MNYKKLLVIIGCVLCSYSLSFSMGWQSESSLQGRLFACSECKKAYTPIAQGKFDEESFDHCWIHNAGGVPRFCLMFCVLALEHLDISKDTWSNQVKRDYIKKIIKIIYLNLQCQELADIRDKTEALEQAVKTFQEEGMQTLDQVLKIQKEAGTVFTE